MGEKRDRMLAAQEDVKAAEARYYESGTSHRGPEWDAMWAADEALSRARAELAASDEPREFLVVAAEGQHTVLAKSIDEVRQQAASLLQATIRGGGPLRPTDPTLWADCQVHGEDGTYHFMNIPVTPPAPGCFRGSHEWVDADQMMPEVVGGNCVLGITTTACQNCGWYQLKDSLAVDPRTGDPGIVVAYAPPDVASLGRIRRPR